MMKLESGPDFILARNTTLPEATAGSAFAVFRGKLGVEETFESVKVHRLELAEALHPDRGGAHGVRLQLAPDHPAAFLAADQAGLGKGGKVFRNGSQRDIEGLGHIGDRHVVFQKHGQDRPPRRVGEGGEDGVEAGRGRAGHAATIAGAAELSTDGLNMKSGAKPDPIAARVVSSWYKCTHLQCVAWEMEGRFVA